MERKPAVAVIFYHIGPYHHARLNAAADKLSVVGIEWSRAMTRGANRPRLRGIAKFRFFRKRQMTTRTRPSFDVRSSLSSTSPEG